MKTIGAFEAKTQFSRLLREVEQGETYEILLRNRPVARLVGIGQQDRQESVRKMVSKVRELRTTLSITRDEIHGWLNEGRK